MSRVKELEVELSKANARIVELEKSAMTIGRLKGEIETAIGVKFTGAYPSTISRDDLLKIHQWIMARAKELV